jgi:hypothetical protein
VITHYLYCYASADGMLFGALGKCPLCGGGLEYSGGRYKCLGYLTAWSKCAFSTTNPERIKGKWKIPEETDNAYLSEVGLFLGSYVSFNRYASLVS